MIFPIQIEISMIEQHYFSSQSIIDCINTHYHISVDTLVLLPIGADRNASVYKAFTKDGLSYFIKLKRGHQDDISVAILALLQAAGIQEIIPPSQTVDGKVTQPIDDSTLVVYPFVEGHNGFSKNLTDEQWVTLGHVFKQIHNMTIPSSIKEKIRKETYSSKWIEALELMMGNLDEIIPPDELALKLKTVIKDHEAVIKRLIDRAKALCPIVQKQSQKLVLCHSDIHAGNVLMDQKGALYVIDWDEPIMAPKERDLMFIGAGVGNVWNDAREEALFYKGYGTPPINRVLIAYYRHDRIIQDIVEYVQSLLLTSDGGEDRLEMLEQVMDQFEANGVIDIAFKTDDGSVPLKEMQRPN